MELRNYSDVLVIGTGVAGLCAAIEAADNGLKVSLITKNSDPAESNTLYAQGGIVGPGYDDSPDLIFQDILKAGSYINNRDAVRLVAEEGPAMVEQFLVDRVNVRFSRDEKGGYELTREAAHSVRRILHSRDKTGFALSKGLLSTALEHENISFHSSLMALDLISNCHHSSDHQQKYRKNSILGAYVLDEEKRKVISFFAPSVIIATGGVGALYEHTSNPSCATGDGIAMAYRAGASVINSEYIQFHPTTLYHRDSENFLISESLRGEGAVLLNRYRQPFMNRYNKELKDLAPRDEVSRAIYNEMEETGSDCVYLDAREIKEHKLDERFPQIFDTCRKLDIDIREDLIPVVPAAHYFCGGIKTDLDGSAGIDGLYAVGESACTGLHGANRLASISLLEGVVFGLRAARHIAAQDRRNVASLIETIPDWVYPRKEESFDSILIDSDMETIRTVMWNYVGIRRSKKRLERALADLNYLRHRVEKFYKQSYVTREIVELRNAVETAIIITRGALSNPKSLGCHYIPDKGESRE
ncbi:L-aspartate oxidase [Spirochaeta isovalerica]|uniref:L-aspartate oxidase n=1 Tax=Spirochaeta isovalerica TaxID=150 RepID=A0A841R5C8_9SPIO|nr:L-aspartate oxidase [Spirochaeta isovalerica]MBB6479023.1 L-aspartate oxidase [Spirochaeta isovalerica]